MFGEGSDTGISSSIVSSELSSTMPKGKVTVNSAYWPTSLSMSILPPKDCTRLWQINKPRPYRAVVIHRAKDTISVENILHVCLLDSFAGVVNFKDEEVLLLM